MRLRLPAVLSIVSLIAAEGTVVAESHPVCNRAKRAWQVEYDKDHPRDGNHALRLVILDAENPAEPMPGARVRIRGTLYRFGLDNPSSPMNYMKKPDDAGGKVLLSGLVDAAPSRGMGNPKSHWRKANLRMDLFGTYATESGQLKDVWIIGAFHTGKDNKKSRGAASRKDYRVSIRIVETDHRDDFESLLKQMDRDEGYEKALEQLRRRFFSGDPCDDTPPDAMAEGDTFTDPETDFPYDEAHP